MVTATSHGGANRDHDGCAGHNRAAPASRSVATHQREGLVHRRAQQAAEELLQQLQRRGAHRRRRLQQLQAQPHAAGLSRRDLRGHLVRVMSDYAVGPTRHAGVGKWDMTDRKTLLSMPQTMHRSWQDQSVLNIRRHGKALRTPGAVSEVIEHDR